MFPKIQLLFFGLKWYNQANLTILDFKQKINHGGEKRRMV